MKAIATTLLLLLFAAACGPAAVRAPAPAGGALAGTYSGLIPCADCPGIQYTLTLLPDGRAVREMTYLEAENGEDRTFTETQRWKMAEAGDQIIVYDAEESEQRLRINDDGSLTMLNQAGQPIESDLNFDLKRVER